MNCEINKRIQIVSASNARNGLEVCSNGPKKNAFISCFNPEALKIAKTNCENKTKCHFNIEYEKSAKACNYVSKYWEIGYKCLTMKSQNPCKDDPCGIGANCTVQYENSFCTCPKETKGNPRVKCCKTLQCG